MYEFISYIYPKKLREAYTRLLDYSNIKVNTDRFLGFILMFGFGLALVASINLKLFFGWNPFLAFFGMFFLFELIVYLWLVLSTDAKGKFVESVLPDALQLMASNLRAGFTTDRALLLAARPEFGPLQEEINRIGKEITTGTDIDDALLDMTNRIKSENLEKTMLLIVTGLRAGGELAPLLEQTAENLRARKQVERRIVSSISTYIIFIFAAIAFGAPLLFGLSSFLVEVLNNIMSNIDLSGTEGVASAAVPLKLSAETLIDPSFVIMYAIISLIALSVLGSLVLGLISKGKEKEGVRYIPILIAVSLSVFFLARFVVKKLLGGLF